MGEAAVVDALGGALNYLLLHARKEDAELGACPRFARHQHARDNRRDLHGHSSTAGHDAAFFITHSLCCSTFARGNEAGAQMSFDTQADGFNSLAVDTGGQTTGTGVLAIFAARAGALKVDAIERTPMGAMQMVAMTSGQACVAATRMLVPNERKADARTFEGAAGGAAVP